MSQLSFERITRADLRRLARIATEEREDFFARRPDWKLLYGRRFVAAALLDQAASHFCNGSSGVNEFSLCLFFSAHAEAPFPNRWSSYRDFGKSKFGHDDDHPQYRGRRVRLFGRSLPCRPNADPFAALQEFLGSGRTPTARQLRQQAVVLISPEAFLGYVVWPTLVR